MKKVELRSWAGFISDFADSINIKYSEAEALLTTKLKECHLTELDILIFINCVNLNYTCLEVATALGISISSVRYRLKKVRERFPQLRTFNKNLPRKHPFVAPKHLSRTDGEYLPDGKKYSGPNKEISELDQFDENDEDNRIIRKF